MVWYAGCNHYITHGEVKGEPIGTATSMHTCDFCVHIDSCKLKKETSIWEQDLDIEKQMDADYVEMLPLDENKGCTGINSWYKDKIVSELYSKEGVKSDGN